MVASFHVARAAAELILHRDKATVLGGGIFEKKNVFATLFQTKIVKIGTQFQTVIHSWTISFLDKHFLLLYRL